MPLGYNGVLEYNENGAVAMYGPIPPHITHHTSHPPGQSGCPHSIPLARRLGDPRYRSASD